MPSVDSRFSLWSKHIFGLSDLRVVTAFLFFMQYFFVNILTHIIVFVIMKIYRGTSEELLIEGSN